MTGSFFKIEELTTQIDLVLKVFMLTSLQSGHTKLIIIMPNVKGGKTQKKRGKLQGNSSWEICHRCAKILLAVEHKMQLA